MEPLNANSISPQTNVQLSSNNQQSRNNNNRSNNNDKAVIFDVFTYIKIGIISGLVIFLAVNAVYGFAVVKTNNISCLVDKGFIWTDTINTYFGMNTIEKNILLIISSLCIDVVFLMSSICWLLYSRSWRFWTTLILFYGTRAIVQGIFQFGFPEGYIWESPNFPSLLVNYDKTNDFFYSGHAGFPLIAALEFNKNGMNLAAIGCVCAAILEAFTVLIMRTHFSIDIFTGMLCAHYFFMINDKYIHYWDKSCIGMNQNDNDVNDKNGFQKAVIKDPGSTTDSDS